MTTIRSTAALPANPAAEGCGLHYTARLTLADGSSDKVGKFAKWAEPVLARGVKLSTGQVGSIPVRVSRLEAGAFLQMRAEQPGGNGRAQLGATADQQVLTTAGWVQLADLTTGHEAEQVVQHVLSPQQMQSICGSLLGDGCLSCTPSENGARYRMTHGAKQSAYIDWKASLLQGLAGGRSVRESDGAISWDFTALPELAPIRKSVYVAGRKDFDDAYLDRLDELALALWVQDDGWVGLHSKELQVRTQGGTGHAEICVEAMTPTAQSRLADMLSRNWEVTVKRDVHPGSGEVTFRFSVPDTMRLLERLAPYFHPSMQYKLPRGLRGRFAVTPDSVQPRLALSPYPVDRVVPKPETRSRRVFSLACPAGWAPVVDHLVIRAAGVV